MDINDDGDSEDPKKNIVAKSFIGIICKQYAICQNRKKNTITNGMNNGTTNGANGETFVGSNPNANKPLANRISNRKKSVKSYRINMLKVKCYNCRKYGHYLRDCKKKKNDKDKDRGGGGGSKEGKGDGKAEKSNIMEVAFIGKEDDGEYYNFDVDCTNNDECLIWYDWLADNATTSYVSHQREAFISYTRLE
jgi:hypothetical protein